MNDKIVNIVMVTDSNYITPVWVMLRSLIINKNKDTTYIVYIIADRLSEVEKDSLRDSFNVSCKEESEIKFIDVDSSQYFDKGVVDENTLKGWSGATLLKFSICSLLPNDLHKVIFLDGDMIALGDISSLYSIPLSDNQWLGAVLDEYENRINSEKTFGMKDEYFNSGCMLMNLDVMREMFLDKMLIKMKKNDTTLYFADQDTYNVVCRGHVKILPSAYNFFLSNFLVDLSVDEFNKYGMSSYCNRTEMIHDIKIVHMIHWRPWKTELNVSEISKYVAKGKPSEIGGGAFSYILRLWLDYYIQSPLYDMKDTFLTKSDNSGGCMMPKGLVSHIHFGPVSLSIIQESYLENVVIALYLGSIRLLRKVRIPGKSQKFRLG